MELTAEELEVIAPEEGDDPQPEPEPEPEPTPEAGEEDDVETGEPVKDDGVPVGAI